ncbi:hypothetical protein LTS18_011535 [Coniosporium uncinatum]|uniref:Uncharacterized protein n=1 Tax=Coniosporium uncinatum TaxID=93489 RepID=A0ACC3DC46_9PEZI|nr:hypothetical protein LTS18_011535 [Coniosporium uncinatum]
MADAAPIDQSAPAHAILNGTADTEMKMEPGADAPLPPPPPAAAAPPSSTTPAPAALATNARASPHPTTSTPAPPPSQPNPHGSPTRVYLNQNVTPHLLEGMKYLAAYE